MQCLPAYRDGPPRRKALVSGFHYHLHIGDDHVLVLGQGVGGFAVQLRHPVVIADFHQILRGLHRHVTIVLGEHRHPLFSDTGAHGDIRRLIGVNRQHLLQIVHDIHIHHLQSLGNGQVGIVDLFLGVSRCQVALIQIDRRLELNTDRSQIVQIPVHGIVDGQAGGHGADGNEQHQADDGHGPDRGVYLTADLTQHKAVQAAEIYPLYRHEKLQEKAGHGPENQKCANASEHHRQPDHIRGNLCRIPRHHIIGVGQHSHRRQKDDHTEGRIFHPYFLGLLPNAQKVDELTFPNRKSLKHHDDQIHNAEVDAASHAGSRGKDKPVFRHIPLEHIDHQRAHNL